MKGLDYNFYCNKNKTDKGDQLPNGNGYAEFYQPFFEKIRFSCENILEIGIDNGYSLMTNYEFFEKSKILGLDIKNCTRFDNDRITTKILDQGNLQELESFVEYCDSNNVSFDFILDDGSHDVIHQQLTFGKFFKLVKPGGFYIIEDLGTSYFSLGESLYGYKQTQEKINSNTINFLNQRPFSSFWINEEDTEFINLNVDFVSIFDKTNRNLSYSTDFKCTNNYPIRSITSIIKRVS